MTPATPATDLGATAFDDEGFYRPGDLVTLADPADPNAGLLFDGRLAEDFKLSTRTFVRVGTLRTALLSTVPILADAVIAGEGHNQVCALGWLNDAETRNVLNDPLPCSATCSIPHASRCNWVKPGTSEPRRRIRSPHRTVDHPGESPRLDAGEITDKSYLNQRQLRSNHHTLIETMYTEPLPNYVITPVSSRSLYRSGHQRGPRTGR